TLTRELLGFPTGVRLGISPQNTRGSFSFRERKLTFLIVSKPHGEHVTSWRLVWLLSLVLPIAPPSVLCSLFATLSRFHIYRLAGNTPPWTTETCFTSTSTLIMRLSAGRSWIWSSTTTGRQ
uniref:Glutamate ionotropic receptor kainate type subunit 1 n=1 Tax=Bos indicus x Bos taurus TaxID=30522 RepID=A0A4W2GZY5_BOBOX